MLALIPKEITSFLALAGPALRTHKSIRSVNT